MCRVSVLSLCGIQWRWHLVWGSRVRCETQLGMHKIEITRRQYGRCHSAAVAIAGCILCTYMSWGGEQSDNIICGKLSERKSQLRHSVRFSKPKSKLTHIQFNFGVGSEISRSNALRDETILRNVIKSYFLFFLFCSIVYRSLLGTINSKIPPAVHQTTIPNPCAVLGFTWMRLKSIYIHIYIYKCGLSKMQSRLWRLHLCSDDVLSLLWFGCKCIALDM